MREISNNYLSATTRTCLAVVCALERLLETVPFESITVKQICEEARISRATFYYHFEDKFDVVQWHYRFVAEEFLFETGRTLSWYDAHYRNTSEVVRHKKLYRRAFKTRGYQALFSYSKRRRIETLEETILQWKKQPLDEELRFQIRALAEAEVASISNWFKNDMPYSTETLCRYLEGIIPRRLYHLLEKPAK